MVAQIVTLQQAKDFLNITTTTFDSELGGFIDAASQMITNRIGPVSGSPTYDEWYDGGRPQIVLRHTPVQSVTSITESYGAATSYTLTPVTLDSGSVAGSFAYTVDLSAGIITRRAAGVAMPFAPGVQNIHVVYTAGYATVPADLVQATNLLISHMWTTQRGGSKRPGTGGDDWNPSHLESWPPRVEEILENYFIPGIA